MNELGSQVFPNKDVMMSYDERVESVGIMISIWDHLAQDTADCAAPDTPQHHETVSGECQDDKPGQIILFSFRQHKTLAYKSLMKLLNSQFILIHSDFFVWLNTFFFLQETYLSMNNIRQNWPILQPCALKAGRNNLICSLIGVCDLLQSCRERDELTSDGLMVWGESQVQWSQAGAAWWHDYMGKLASHQSLQTLRLSVIGQHSPG